MRKPGLGAALCLLLTASAAHAGEATWLDKQITFLYPPTAAIPCVLFTLQGMTQANPDVVGPHASVFAFPTTAVGYQEKFALLLTAATNGQPVNAVTDGTVAPCGSATGFVFANTTVVSINYQRP